MIKKVQEKSMNYGLMLNIQKTKVMTTRKTNIIKVDRREIEAVESFIFLGCQITRNGVCEIKQNKKMIVTGKSVHSKTCATF